MYTHIHEHVHIHAHTYLHTGSLSKILLPAWTMSAFRIWIVDIHMPAYINGMWLPYDQRSCIWVLTDSLAWNKQTSAMMVQNKMSSTPHISPLKKKSCWTYCVRVLFEVLVMFLQNDCFVGELSHLWNLTSKKKWDILIPTPNNYLEVERIR